MANETQKLSKEELQEDEFVEGAVRFVEYVQENAQAFIAGLVGIVVVILGVNYFIKTQEQSQADAAALLGDMLIAEQAGQKEEAIRTGEQLQTAYAGTIASAQATVLLGNIQFNSGNYAEAERHFQSYLQNYDPVDVLSLAANNGLAACLEAQGQVEQAAQRYEEIAARHKGLASAGQAIMKAAWCYAQLGDRDKQRALLQSVIDEYARFPVAARARTEIEML